MLCEGQNAGDNSSPLKEASQVLHVLCVQAHGPGLGNTTTLLLSFPASTLIALRHKGHWLSCQESMPSPLLGVGCGGKSGSVGHECA